MIESYKTLGIPFKLTKRLNLKISVGAIKYLQFIFESTFALNNQFQMFQIKKDTWKTMDFKHT